MSTLITRLLANEDTASEASRALARKGFDDGAVRVVSNSGGSARESMVDFGVSDSTADAYIDHLDSGNALIAVRAPFGMAGDAMSALRPFDAIEVDVEQEQHISYKTNPEDALSIIPGNKKFLTDRSSVGTGTGFSDMFGWSLLTDRQRGKASVETETISKKLGMPLLTNRQRGKAGVDTSTVSEKIGLATIKKPRGGKSIIRNPTPFSSALGWPTIIRD